MHTRKAGTSDGRDTGTTRESLANNPYHQHCSLPSGPLRARTHSGHDSMHGKRGKGYTVANTHGPRETRPTMRKKTKKKGAQHLLHSPPLPTATPTSSQPASSRTGVKHLAPLKRTQKLVVRLANQGRIVLLRLRSSKNKLTKSRK